MVTLYDLGISISFIVGNSKISVKNAAESEKDYDSNELTTILFREYENVSLEFTSMSDEDRIYFDGIDLLPAELCEIDDAGDLYLNPQKDEMVYPLFEYSSEYYAMRVGKYELKIYHNGIIYYQWFTVLPKNINGAEWEIMQQELEIEMQGLSTDIIRKNISLGNNKNEVVPSQELYRFFVIKKHFNNILAALIDLKDKPKYKVQKGRTSHNNGVVGVIMKYNGGYDWFKTTHRNADGCSSTTYEESKVYDIINNNRFNQNPKKYSCAVCKTVNSLTGSYIAYVDEETFLANPFKYINNAYDKSENDASGYDLTKTR